MSLTRVLHVVGPAAGGMARAAESTVAALRAAGVDAELLPLVPRALPSLAASLGRGGWDAVHAHGLKAALACRALATGLRRPPPLWIGLHGVPRRGAGAVARPLLRAALGGAALLPVSRAMARWLRQRGLRPAAVVPPPLACDAEPPTREAARRALGLPHEAFLVACVARLAPEKGVDLLLTAWGACLRRHPELARRARLVVVGTGPAARALRRRAHALGLDEACLFAGHVPDAGRWLRAFDAVAVPSRSEGLGLVAVEALACRVPVLAAAVGGLPEVLGGGRFGWLLPVADREAWVEALARVATGRWRADPERLARGERWARARHAPDRVAARLLRAYHRAGRPRGSGPA